MQIVVKPKVTRCLILFLVTEIVWENFCITERFKANQAKLYNPNSFFWRTHDQKEIDYLEEYNQQFQAFEFKWAKNTAKIPQEFVQNYPNTTFKLINQNNFLEFLE